jgi:hypothetical protein
LLKKWCALHVFANVSESNAHVTLDEVTGLVANAIARCKGIVSHDRKGLKNDGKLVAPKKTRKRKHNFIKSAILKKCTILSLLFLF